jgi:hypothetical protein
MKTYFAIITACLIATSIPAFAEPPSFTTGRATMTNPGLFTCDPSLGQKGPKARVSAVGKITSDDGKEWIVPAKTQFSTTPKAPDLHNICNGVTPRSIAEVDISAIPVLQANGEEEFIAYIFGDNYFELYVNGKLLAVDAVPFTPFNSSIVRFKAKRPVTLAVKMVDWEENLGLGSEKNSGSNFHPGDGGLVMHVKDADGKTVALNDGSWRAQVYYISPLNNRTCLKISGTLRDSSDCKMVGAANGTRFSAAHWPIPNGWEQANFDATAWPLATTFSNETVGVRGKSSYTNFSNVFDTPGADAQFIWSSNLILDNVVLLRKTFE